MHFGVPQPGQDQNPGIRGCLSEVREAFQPLVGAKVEIQQDEIRLLASGGSNGVRRGSGFGHDNPAGPALDEQAQTGPDERMVVNEFDAYAAGVVSIQRLIRRQLEWNVNRHNAAALVSCTDSYMTPQSGHAFGDRLWCKVPRRLARCAQVLDLHYQKLRLPTNPKT